MVTQSVRIKKERHLLLFSSLIALLFALTGISLGWWMGSLVILFDGAYSFFSLALTLVSLAAAAYINRPTNTANPAFVENAVIAFKGAVITLMCLFSLYSALVALFSGGQEVDANIALIFAVVNVVGCTLSYLVMKRGAAKINSPLVDAESKQWVMDAIISGAVLVGFLLAKGLTLTAYSAYAVYADPIMVVIASLYFVAIPVKMTFTALKQLQTLQLKTV
ncbi:cobalt-zinc-cadmium resistance protein [Psychromonas marina]|uniref:Cobalt-zinc-cadmium resistance protein n=1 Tax=Psychromonas marina TaxID=88364 RepID=A0ABQ6E410_9GAMM|nr:cation transporter [Psychromonas marina]GLS92102.1 cobalt-zinc-cadmium resistance protein [Psychromonas marina]